MGKASQFVSKAARSVADRRRNQDESVRSVLASVDRVSALSARVVSDDERQESLDALWALYAEASVKSEFKDSRYVDALNYAGELVLDEDSDDSDDDSDEYAFAFEASESELDALAYDDYYEE